MTAEERMAYFQGEKRRSNVSSLKTTGRNWNLIFFKFKFFVAVILFVIFLSLDYTGYKIHSIGSEEIIEEIISDFNLTEIEAFVL